MGCQGVPLGLERLVTRVIPGLVICQMICIHALYSRYNSLPCLFFSHCSRIFFACGGPFSMISSTLAAAHATSAPTSRPPHRSLARHFASRGSATPFPEPLATAHRHHAEPSTPHAKPREDCRVARPDDTDANQANPTPNQTRLPYDPLFATARQPRHASRSGRWLARKRSTSTTDRRAPGDTGRGAVPRLDLIVGLELLHLLSLLRPHACTPYLRYRSAAAPTAESCSRREARGTQ